MVDLDARLTFCLVDRFHEALVGVINPVIGSDAVVKDSSDGVKCGLELAAHLVLVIGLVLALGYLSAQGVSHALVLGHCLLVLVELADNQGGLRLLGEDLGLDLFSVIHDGLEVLAVSLQVSLVHEGVLLGGQAQGIVFVLQ